MRYRDACTCWPYVPAMLAGLMPIMAVPELPLLLSRSVGMIR